MMEVIILGGVALFFVLVVRLVSSPFARDGAVNSTLHQQSYQGYDGANVGCVAILLLGFFIFLLVVLVISSLPV